MVRKAIQRLGWRFSEALKKPDNSFRINSQDIQALQDIDAYIEEKQKQQFKDQELFAKLYIYLMMKVNEADKTSVYDKNARRKIGNLLKKPMQQIIEDFRQSMNDSELYELMEEIGVKMKHPLSKSEEERANDINNISDAIKSPENMDRLTGEVWDYQTVADCLEADVNQAIESFESR